jgi:hypothetical protein
MVPISPTAQVVARRLLAPARAPAASDDPSDQLRQQLTEADRVVRDLTRALSRPLGAQAYHALVARALAQSQKFHPALALLTIGSPLEPTLQGLEQAAQRHGPDALVDGLVTLIAVLTDLLGRLIGEDMAVLLVARAAPSVSDIDRDNASATTLPDDPGTAA